MLLPVEGAKMNADSKRSIRNACRLVACSSLMIFAIGHGLLIAQQGSPENVVASTRAGAPPYTKPSASENNHASDPNAALIDELEKMRARISELEAQLKAQQGGAPAVVNATLTNGQPAAAESSSLAKPALHESREQEAKPVQKPEPAAPFAYADWTWLNGNPRTKHPVWDSKFFTPEIRFDANYISSFNHPRDDSLGGSTETFRSNEVQIEQISFGGDFHVDNVRARILTMGGLFGVTTPRNDASPGRGQWDLRGAYKYFSEANGGYHFNVNHGLNFDAGIFVSYIGLFSYYNFDNWTYQPSYVSSNTPWFFNGIRIQWFPTNTLKIEPWIINGWQSYARFNGHLGFGGQILWQPNENLKLVFNNYGVGQDNLAYQIVTPGAAHPVQPNPLAKAERLHTDDSIEFKYYDNKMNGKGLSKAAFSFTVDAGCESGGGLSCSKGPNKEAFIGWMLYNRFWFDNDLYAITLGGGEMNNPGRYLTLLPPINGATAARGTPYFTENPGQPAFQWNATLNFQYMPKQWITWWAEAGFRHSNVPYFAGSGGVTPPTGNNGYPAQYACNDGAPAGTTLTSTSCANDGGVWYPDLRTRQAVLSGG